MSICLKTPRVFLFHTALLWQTSVLQLMSAGCTRSFIMPFREGIKRVKEWSLRLRKESWKVAAGAALKLRATALCLEIKTSGSTLLICFLHNAWHGCMWMFHSEKGWKEDRPLAYTTVHGDRHRCWIQPLQRVHGVNSKYELILYRDAKLNKFQVKLMPSAVLSVDL